MKRIVPRFAFDALCKNACRGVRVAVCGAGDGVDMDSTAARVCVRDLWGRVVWRLWKTGVLVRVCKGEVKRKAGDVRVTVIL